MIGRGTRPPPKTRFVNCDHSQCVGCSQRRDLKRMVVVMLPDGRGLACCSGEAACLAFAHGERNAIIRAGLAKGVGLPGNWKGPNPAITI